MDTEHLGKLNQKHSQQHEHQSKTTTQKRVNKTVLTVW